MGGIFDLNSRFMQSLSKLADLVWINILTLICSIPVFTVGASLTAMHAMVYKLYKNKEGHVTRQYFKEFRSNFRQATLLWLVCLAAGLVLGVDIWMFSNRLEDVAVILKVIVCVIVILYLFGFSWMFVLQSRYQTTIRNQIKNCFAVSLMYAPTTLAMLALLVLPFVLVLIINQVLPFYLMFGLSAPAYVQAMLYNRVFVKLERSVKS